MAKKSLTLTLSVEQYVKLIAQAQLAGLSLSEYARRRIFGFKITPKIPYCDKVAISILNQIGGLIKQLYKTEKVDSKETYILLTEIKQLLKKVREKNDSEETAK